MRDKILVEFGDYSRACKGMGDFVFNAKSFFKNPKDFKLILLTGGSDVDPKNYGDSSPLKYCHFWSERDDTELEIARVAMEEGIPMAGICRGLQLLNVIAGGKLMHDITGHAGCTHPMETVEGEIITVNSLHHQMAIPEEDSIVIGWSQNKLSKSYIGFKDEKMEYTGKEIEAVIYPNIKSFGVQYHPEMMKEGSPGHSFFYNKVAHMLESFDDFVKVHEELVHGKKNSKHYASSM